MAEAQVGGVIPVVLGQNDFGPVAGGEDGIEEEQVVRVDVDGEEVEGIRCVLWMRYFVFTKNVCDITRVQIRCV